LVASLTPVSSNQHPLKPLVEDASPQKKEAAKSTQSNAKPVNFDPLSEVTMDPLSKMVADVSFKEKVITLFFQSQISNQDS
jgi:hypothetical protein